MCSVSHYSLNVKCSLLEVLSRRLWNVWTCWQTGHQGQAFEGHSLGLMSSFVLCFLSARGAVRSPAPCPCFHQLPHAFLTMITSKSEGQNQSFLLQGVSGRYFVTGMRKVTDMDISDISQAPNKEWNCNRKQGGTSQKGRKAKGDCPRWYLGIWLL